MVVNSSKCTFHFISINPHNPREVLFLLGFFELFWFCACGWVYLGGLVKVYSTKAINNILNIFNNVVTGDVISASGPIGIL